MTLDTYLLIASNLATNTDNRHNFGFMVIDLIVRLNARMKVNPKPSLQVPRTKTEN
jgi:peptidyl-tRNA hydrolase